MYSRLIPFYLIAFLAINFTPGFLSGAEKHPKEEPLANSVSTKGQTNLLLGKKVEASGHWNKQVPQLAIDGKSNDVNAHWACENFPATLTVDIGKETAISEICVWPYWADGRVYKYTVEGSNDQKQWQMLADHSANTICSSKEGNKFQIQRQNFRYLKLTVLDSTVRKSGAHIIEFAAYTTANSQQLTGGILSVNQRCPQFGQVQSEQIEKGIKLTGWRGERVNAQVYVASTQVTKQLRIAPLTLNKGQKIISGEPYFIRYTRVNRDVLPDILDIQKISTQEAGQNRPIWVSFDIPRDAEPGVYQGTLKVYSEAGNINFPIELKILTAQIPEPKNWKFHLDLWQYPYSVSRWHNVTPWSPEHFALLKPIMKRLADAGQKNITCSIVHEAWNAQTYDWTPSMIEWTKKSDGSWKYDYTIFDKWVNFMTTEIGLKGQIVCYTMIPWHLQFRYFDEAKNQNIDLKCNPNSAEFEDLWGHFLTDFKKHLKEKNWLDRTAVGIDERPDHLLKPTLRVLNKYAPELRMVSAINTPSALTENVYEISPSIQHAHTITPALLKKRKEANKITTFYVCCSPATPNTFAFSPLAESAWLPLFATAQDFDGFLRWAYNAWVENPFQSTDFVTWPSGDCFLVYPGNLSSMRFERLRDGIELTEKIKILKSQNNIQLNQKIDQALKVFTQEQAKKKGVHEQNVETIEKIVNSIQ